MLLDSIRWEALNLTGWPAWRRANSLEDMGAIVIRWLEGSDRFLPWHIGPPDPETAEIIEPLIALNLKGLMTTNSQPGIEPYGSDCRLWIPEHPCSIISWKLFSPPQSGPSPRPSSSSSAPTKFLTAWALSQTGSVSKPSSATSTMTPRQSQWRQCWQLSIEFAALSVLANPRPE